MTLVVLADDAFAFLFSWESMSLASWALVMAHHEEAENRRAGFVYLVRASFGTLALLLAFGLLAGAGRTLRVAAMRAAGVAPGLAAVILLLVLIGAGSKAGLVPLHVWLPARASGSAQPRLGADERRDDQGRCLRLYPHRLRPDRRAAMVVSLLVLALGGVTAVMGILYAMLQTDLKRLLAYSTVENIGVIFVGLGLALAFKASGMPAAAALAMTAALFHVLNHSLFKSLLFFGAGAVLNATGLRDLEQLGGLIRRMPQTAFVFLVGAVAISALPPLNGFVSRVADVPGDPPQPRLADSGH